MPTPQPPPSNSKITAARNARPLATKAPTTSDFDPATLQHGDKPGDTLAVTTVPISQAATLAAALAAIKDAPAAVVPSTVDDACDQLAGQGGLSPRESDVLRLLARGRTTTRIQEELHISMNTANTHIRHVFQKLGVHSRQELLDLVEKAMGTAKSN